MRQFVSPERFRRLSEQYPSGRIPVRADGNLTRPLEGVRVLVLEDNDAVRTAIGRFLERAGCTVLSAGEPEAALSAARAWPGHLDLALIDLVLPKMSGPECADLLREDRPGLLIVHMSGYAEGISEGYPGDDTPILLQKPFARDELIEKISSLLGTRPAPE